MIPRDNNRVVDVGRVRQIQLTIATIRDDQLLTDTAVSKSMSSSSPPASQPFVLLSWSSWADQADHSTATAHRPAGVILNTSDPTGSVRAITLPVTPAASTPTKLSIARRSCTRSRVTRINQMPSRSTGKFGCRAGKPPVMTVTI